MILEVGMLSDVGQKREQNEDYLGMYRPPDANQRRHKGDLFLVADGMGGHQLGEVASRVAVEQIIQAYTTVSAQAGVADLVKAVTAANTAIYALGQSQDYQRRMGTTLVGALILDRTLHIVNVGDSRAYLVRGTHIEQISQDHSLVAEQVRMGLIQAEQAENASYRNAITRALGSKPEVKVDTFTRELQAGDTIVLCTDGLSGLVKDEEIALVVSRQPPAQAVASLVGMANARGGKDNITTIVVKAYDDVRPKRRVQWPVWAVAGAALLLAGLLALVPFTLGVGTDLPRALPSVAPVELTGAQSPDQQDKFARLLGYLDRNDLLIKVGLSPSEPWPPLEPPVAFVLLTGPIIRLDSQQPCFTLEMGGQAFGIECPEPLQDVQLAKGELVNVLGSLEQATGRIRPVAIAVSKVKWLGLGAEWKNWYDVLGSGKQLLVYTVVSSYTVLKAGGHDLMQEYGFKPGEAVAIYGQWQIVTGPQGQNVGLPAFDQIFRLDNGIYTQVK